jgi:hypothetical protein
METTMGRYYESAALDPLIQRPIGTILNPAAPDIYGEADEAAYKKFLLMTGRLVMDDGYITVVYKPGD